MLGLCVRILAVLLLALAAPAVARADGSHGDHEAPAPMDHSQMDHGSMDHGQMDHGETSSPGHDHGAPAPAPDGGHSGHGAPETAPEAGGHSGHGGGSPAAPDRSTRLSVIGGFAAANVAIVGGAFLLRRRRPGRARGAAA